MTLARSLWQENCTTAAAALAHPFIRDIADGSLPNRTFSAYVAQDAFFLDAYARAYGLAMSRSAERETLLAFAGLIAGVRDELVLHDDYAQEWGVDVNNVAPTETTMVYTNFLLATAATGSVGLICAAMAPCMRLYAHLGQELARIGAEPDNPYLDWIRTYSGTEFELLAQSLERLLDKHCTGEPVERAIYRQAMNLELRFFDSATSELS